MSKDLSVVRWAVLVALMLFALAAVAFPDARGSVVSAAGHALIAPTLGGDPCSGGE